MPTAKQKLKNQRSKSFQKTISKVVMTTKQTKRKNIMIFKSKLFLIFKNLPFMMLLCLSFYRFTLLTYFLPFYVGEWNDVKLFLPFCAMFYKSFFTTSIIMSKLSFFLRYFMAYHKTATMPTTMKTKLKSCEIRIEPRYKLSVLKPSINILPVP